MVLREVLQRPTSVPLKYIENYSENCKKKEYSNFTEEILFDDAKLNRF